MKNLSTVLLLVIFSSSAMQLPLPAHAHDFNYKSGFEDAKMLDSNFTIGDEFISQNDEQKQLLFSNPAIVDTGKSSPEPQQKKTEIQQMIKKHRSRLQIGADYSYAYLKPEGKTSFDGSLGGLQGLYEYWAPSHFYAAGKLAWKQGRVSGHAGHRSLLYIDTQERLGYAMKWEKPDLVWSIYSGLGFRYLGHDFHPHDGRSITLNYSEFYVPVGWTAEFTINSWFALDVNFTWMPQIFPTVWIDPLRGASWSLKRKFANFYVELPLDFTPTKNNQYHIIVTPFYEYWQDGRTTAKTTSGLSLGLTENTYQFFGIDVNFGYCF